MRHSHGLRASSVAAASGIVTTGLVLNLDAGNLASYPGSGTTWTDLSGYGNNATLTNGPTYSSANGGSIVFDGVNDTVSIPASANQAMGTGDCTFEWWAKTSDSTGGYAYSSNDFLNITYTTNLYYQGLFGYTTMFFANTAHYNNSWHHHVITRISGTVRWYIDTIQVGTGPDSYTYTNNNPILLMQGYYGFTAGNMAVWRMYKNKGLTSAEVTQNFNALVGRYGV